MCYVIQTQKLQFGDIMQNGINRVSCIDYELFGTLSKVAQRYRDLFSFCYWKTSNTCKSRQKSITKKPHVLFT